MARLSMGIIVLLGLTGLAVTFGTFHVFVQWGLLVHTAVGLVALPLLVWYLFRHWFEDRRYRVSHVVVLGYAAGAALLVCCLSGLVVTGQGVWGVSSSPLWRQVHMISTFALAVSLLPHLLIPMVRLVKHFHARFLGGYLAWTGGVAAAGVLLVLGLGHLYSGIQVKNEFPAGYNFLHGKDRPFAPSLARTDTGGAFDSRSLSGSRSCGTPGCHSQIVSEWLSSAHRYAAMDPFFQGIQKVMAAQNGPESTRYCGGCHDPISLFSGTKNLFVEDLTSQAGYQEGISCLSCHAIRETDLKGNANYVITQFPSYLWQWQTRGGARLARDFLIRTYPGQHSRLSKRMFKAPEYCAACHKQFIDKEVNQVGWVQLQNQYDNWASSHWHVKDDPRRTIECRECHMPLVDSKDPARGDTADYNRTALDGKHRSHRFVAANAMVPEMLKLPGWEEQVRLTGEWLAGRFEIPEIRDKWAEGPIVQVDLDVPEKVRSGAKLPVRVIFTSRKVGHDFPTGPLDIIQSWLELRVENEDGEVVFRSGSRNVKNFIQPGSFLFKAEPVDQNGNLIDRHNLWEMVGVRFRRALFPGFSDSVDFSVACTGEVASTEGRQRATGPAPQLDVEAPMNPGGYTVTAILWYRKVDQFLINFLMGEDSGVTAPAMEVARASARVEVMPE
ncbi:MAG: multiheme c-type cytochrome [Acidobacteriota bacterium]